MVKVIVAKTKYDCEHLIGSFVDESNYGFCNIISKYINENKEIIYDNVKKEYGLIAENNTVATYNHNRIKKFL